MTLPMIIALAVTVLMIILIMVDKLPFGAPPLLALLLLVVFGVTDIKTAFGGFANPTIVMLASFMAIIAALQKTSFIVKFKQTMFNMASKGGFKAYVLLILIVMLGCSLFGTGSTAYYVLVIGLLSTLPYSKQLPPSRVLMPAGFAANHPLLPFNTALQYGIVIAVLESAGVAANVNLVKFSLVNLCLSIGFLVWCILAYKILPDHPIAEAKEEALHAGEQKVALTKNQELITYFSFVLAVVGMILQSKIGDAGYAITGLAEMSEGSVLLNGEDVTKKSIRYKNTHGLSHIPEDRHKHGLVLDYNLGYNLVLQQYFEKDFQKYSFLKNDSIYDYSDKLIEDYDIRSSEGAYTSARSMSGGNQQKAIVAREVSRDHDILLAVQPTRGLDVGAIEYIHRELIKQRDAGAAILLVSLELDEVMNLSDRILVMFEGSIVADLDPKKVTVQELGLYMAGSKKEGGKS